MAADSFEQEVDGEALEKPMSVALLKGPLSLPEVRKALVLARRKVYAAGTVTA